MQGYRSCWHSFFKQWSLCWNSFVLKWQAMTAADLHLRHISSNSTFSWTVISFLCFWGALPASLVACPISLLVLFKVYGIALNTMKNTREPWEITLTAICNLLDRRTAAHAEMISVTWPFKWILTIRAHCNSNRWLRNYYSIVYINFMELW